LFARLHPEPAERADSGTSSDAWGEQTATIEKGRDVKPKQAAPAFVFVASLALAACGTASTNVAAPSTPVYRFGVVGNRGKIAQLELRTPTLVAGISGKVVQIATSNSDGYALTSSGTVWAWGVGSYGELGDGKTPPYDTRAVRVDFPAGVKVTSLANPMPFDGALAIDSSGHVWGWGLNADGDLCLSGLTKPRPSQIALSDVTLATGARTHSLFYSKDQVYACGSGAYGVLGNGSTTSSSTPTAVVGLPSTVRVTALTSSWEGSGALLRNGAYFNWGYNAAGQLGNGSTANSDEPVEVKLPADIRQVFQGGSGATNGQTIAILANGSVWAWGDNKKGQLGDGSRTDSGVPVPVDVPAGVTFVRVNAGGYSCYAIDNLGRLWAWGGNENGQLGTRISARFETKPVDVRIRLKQVSSTASNVAGFDQR
jgi:alpha-tubulin suppressor-like RCC1 family protein